MATRAHWLARAAALIVVVIAVLLWRGCRPAPDIAPADFIDDTVKLESPKLDLELVSVRGTAKQVSTDWVCQFRCLEKQGCRADVRVVIHYRSQGERRALKLTGRFNGANGDILWVGRGQRPPEAVGRIDKVVVDVVAPFDPAAPIPTLIQ